MKAPPKANPVSLPEIEFFVRGPVVPPQGGESRPPPDSPAKPQPVFTIRAFKELLPAEKTIVGYCRSEFTLETGPSKIVKLIPRERKDAALDFLDTVHNTGQWSEPTCWKFLSHFESEQIAMRTFIEESCFTPQTRNILLARLAAL